MQRKEVAQRTGIAGKTGKSFFAGLGPADQAQQATASGTGMFHQFQRHAPHRVPRIDFHHGLEPTVTLWRVINQGVDADRAGKADALQFSFDAGEDFAVEVLNALRNVRLCRE